MNRTEAFPRPQQMRAVSVEAALDPVLESLVSVVPDASGMVMPGIKEQLSSGSEYDADFLVLGSGPAGYVAAIRAAQLGARVVVVEKGDVGGVCLNIGCIPTKTLLGSVSVLDSVRRGEEFGVKVAGYSVDVRRMMARKERVVKTLTSGVEGLFRKNKCRLVRGTGRLVETHKVAIDTAGGTEFVSADKILICTGSVPAVVPIPGLPIGGDVWTSTEALSFSTVPASLLVIGAGAIGLEAGYTFARLGSKVVVVEMMSQILPAADGETAGMLQKSLEKTGMEFRLASTVSSAVDVPGAKRVTVKSESGEDTVECEKVLMAVGRRAMLDGLGLDECRVDHTKRKINVNEHLQTNVPSIYAAGDVIGEPMLAHVAWTESIVAVEHAMGVEARMDWRAFPACVYTTPECASVGITEEQARERYADVRIGRFSFSHNGKALGIGESEGQVKFIADGKYGQILGVHMVGPHVTDLIAEAALAMKNELTIDEVVATIHPHPTLSEVVQEAAYDVLGRSIHK